MLKVTDKQFWIHPYLKSNLDLLKEAIRNKWDGIMIGDGMEGCLSGETEIVTKEGLKQLKDCNRQEIVWSKDFEQNTSLFVPAIVINSGIKEVFELELEDGKIVKATKDHKFFIIRDNKIIEEKLSNIKSGYICCESYNSKVKSIKHIGKEQTYDLKVPYYNNFILANSIITHNSGKTVLAAKCCYYMAYNEKTGKSTFNIDSIAWTSKQIEKAIQNANPGDSILCDEFVLAGLSTDAMTEMQNLLIKYFTLIRKKRLFIYLVVPYFYLLRRYFALGRPRALIHIFSPDGIKRGYYRFYNYEQKRYLYFKGIKTWSYPKDCDSSFIGESRIKNISELGIDEEEYERRKDKAIQGIFKKKDDKVNKYIDRFYHLIGYLREKESYMWKEMPIKLGIGMSYVAIQRGYSRYLERMMDKESKEAEKDRIKFKMPEKSKLD